MTSEELWQRVGRILKEAREARDWSLAKTGELAGVDGKTIGSIEAGDVGQVDKLERHAQAFGRTVVDVLVDALERTKRPLSPEAAQLLRKFERISVPARQALLLAAQAYPNVDEEGSPTARQSPRGP